MSLQIAAPSSSGVVTKAGGQPEPPARGGSSFSSSPLPKPGTKITTTEPKPGLGQGKPHRAQSWGVSDPKSSREGAGGHHHRLFSRLHRLHSPQKRHQRWFASPAHGSLHKHPACEAIPGGVRVPSPLWGAVGGGAALLAGFAVPFLPMQQSPRGQGGGNEGAGRAAAPQRRCPTASPPAP